MGGGEGPTVSSCEKFKKTLKNTSLRAELTDGKLNQNGIFSLVVQFFFMIQSCLWMSLFLQVASRHVAVLVSYILLVKEK